MILLMTVIQGRNHFPKAAMLMSCVLKCAGKRFLAWKRASRQFCWLAWPLIIWLPCNLLSDVSARAAVSAGSAGDSLQAGVWELRAAGRYRAALDTARSIAERQARLETTPTWEAINGTWQVTTLEFIASLPDTAQRHLAEADSLKQQIDLAYAEHDYVTGLRLAQRRQVLVARYLGDRFPEVAGVIQQVGTGLLRTGDFTGAETFFREALALRLRLLPNEHPDLAASYYSVAALLHRRGDYQGAAELIRLALRIARVCWGDDNLDTARYMSSLGSDLLGQGDYATAEPLFRQALVLYRKLLEGDHPLLANTLDGLAATLKMKGDLAAAEQYYRESLAMRHRVLPEAHPDIAWSLSNLAGILYEEENLTGAQNLLRQALDILERDLGDGRERLDLALLQKNLAQVVLERGNVAEAEQILQEARGIIERVVGERSRSYAEVQHDLAAVLCRQGAYVEADSLYQSALAIYRAFLGEEHPDVAWCLCDYAQCLHAQGDDRRASQLLARSAAIFEIARRRAGTATERATFRDSPYAQLAAVYLLLGEKDLAWPATERGLGRALADLLLATGQRFLLPEELAREKTLQKELSHLEGQLAGLQGAAVTTTSGPAADDFRRLRNRLLVAEADWSTFQREMDVKYPVTEGRAFTCARVQRALAADTALMGWLHVEISPGETVSWGYVIRHEGAVHWCALPGDGSRQNPAEADVAAYRTALLQAGDWPLRVTSVDRIDAMAGELYRSWVQPLAPHLTGVHRLVILPAGPLQGIPLEALVDSGGVYLGDRYTISYAPSATVYTWLWEQRTREQLPSLQRALVAGDPSCTPRLPWSRVEVEKVAAVIPQVTTLLGEDFSEPEFARMSGEDALQDFDIIHLATHAQIDDARPERSALILAQDNLPDPLAAAMADQPVHDGFLTVKEIVRHWHLQAELVTLSGCRTALGREAAGEGYLGFTNTFLQIGARSLVVSLWRVEDRATSQLMGRFYDYLMAHGSEEGQGHADTRLSKAEALCQAKQWLRGLTDETGQEIYRHPTYWSGFILVGDPR